LIREPVADPFAVVLKAVLLSNCCYGSESLAGCCLGLSFRLRILAGREVILGGWKLL